MLVVNIMTSCFIAFGAGIAGFVAYLILEHEGRKDALAGMALPALVGAIPLALMQEGALVHPPGDYLMVFAYLITWMATIAIAQSSWNRVAR